MFRSKRKNSDVNGVLWSADRSVVPEVELVGIIGVSGTMGAVGAHRCREGRS